MLRLVILFKVHAARKIESVVRECKIMVWTSPSVTSILFGYCCPFTEKCSSSSQVGGTMTGSDVQHGKVGTKSPVVTGVSIVRGETGYLEDTNKTLKWYEASGSQGEGYLRTVAKHL